MNKNGGSPIISFKGVSKIFLDVGEPVVVIKDLDFSVAGGDFIAIRGASGVGKSTLLHLLGLLDVPTGGRVFFHNEEVTRFSDKRLSQIRNRDIGFVFQFHHLLPDFTAWENVLMPRRIAGKITRQDNALAHELLELMGLGHRLKHLPSELSGGERQRLALARALVHRPSLLLADEPSGNLDEDNTRILHKLLKDVQQQFRLTIVIATHDMNLAGLAEKRYLMRDCQIIPDAGDGLG